MSFTSCLLGVVCLLALVSIGSCRRRYQDEDEMVGSRSCRLNQGRLCIPTACSKAQCTLFKSAVCVDDMCGCEARFFNYMPQEKTYRDVSEMCSSGTFVLNFFNFSTNATYQLTDREAFVSLYKPLFDYAKTGKYHETSVMLQHGDDELTEKAVLSESRILTGKPGKDTHAALLHDEDPTAIFEYFKQFNLLVVEILSDITNYLQVVTEAHPTQANIDKLKTAIRTLSALKRTARDEAREVSDSGTKYDSEAYPAHLQDATVLKAILSDEGPYTTAVKSGKVAISDTDAISQLQEQAFLCI